MTDAAYEIEWRYLDELADGARPFDEAHCAFLIRYATYVFENQDYRGEFACDVPSAPKLLAQITQAFHGVTLGDGRCEFFSYLDGAGFRYYMPAAMCFSVTYDGGGSDTPQRTYWSLLPTVAPRHFGKGHGQSFDCDAFIARCNLDAAQVRAIYAFLCFMAVEREEGVDAEQLPAMRKWRAAAKRALADNAGRGP